MIRSRPQTPVECVSTAAAGVPVSGRGLVHNRCAAPVRGERELQSLSVQRVEVTTVSARFSSATRAAGSHSGLVPSMIGFDGIVRVLLHDMARGGQLLIEHSRVCRCPICGHLARA